MIIKSLTDNLQKAFEELNKLKFNNELPEIAITVQSKPKNKKQEVLGWCTAQPIWIQKDEITGLELGKYEINLVAEALNRSYEEIMCTFIHELCHLSNINKRIEDCSKRGKHNENFKKEAERVGLIVEQGEKTGWSMTHLSDSLLEEINNLSIEKNVFNTYRYETLKERKPRNTTPMYKYSCPSCNKDFKSKIENMSVMCNDCEVEFVLLENNKKSIDGED